MCDPNESLSQDFELGIRLVLRTFVFYEPNLDDSVVSDCDDTHSCTDDAIPASCTPVSALAVGNTRQTFFCLPEDILSGTQPVCPPSPFLAPNIDSESVVDVRSDRTEEGSRMAPRASGSPTARDRAFWTSVTEDSWMNDELATCGQPARHRSGWLSPVGIRWL